MSLHAPVTEVLSREAILLLLNSLGADLPLDTRLADDVLKKRLHTTIEAIQRFNDVIPDPPLNPARFPKWHSTSISSLAETMVKRSVEEAVMGGADSSFGDTPFYLVRRCLYTMAAKWASVPRLSSWLFQDDGQKSAIIIRFLDVHTLLDQTPVIPVLYLHRVRGEENKATTGYQWLKRNEDVASVSASVDEQRLLLLILEKNAKVLSKDYNPGRGLFESDFSLSFFLPLSPLSRTDIARLGQNNGCDVCGKTGKSLCSKCAVARYCSRECQKADWAQHKRLCQSLAGAKWMRFKMKTPTEGMERITGQTGLNHVTFINRHDSSLSSNLRKADQTTIQSIFPNAHGSKPFIVKIQLGPALLVYDRLRTFQAYLIPEGNEEAYPILKRLIENGPLFGKAYCWARRTSNERDLMVVADRLPDQNISW